MDLENPGCLEIEFDWLVIVARAWNAVNKNNANLFRRHPLQYHDC